MYEDKISLISSYYISYEDIRIRPNWVDIQFKFVLVTTFDSYSYSNSFKKYKYKCGKDTIRFVFDPFPPQPMQQLLFSMLSYVTFYLTSLVFGQLKCTLSPEHFINTKFVETSTFIVQKVHIHCAIPLMSGDFFLNLTKKMHFDLSAFFPYVDVIG